MKLWVTTTSVTLQAGQLWISLENVFYNISIVSCHFYTLHIKTPHKPFSIKLINIDHHNKTNRMTNICVTLQSICAILQSTNKLIFKQISQFSLKYWLFCKVKVTFIYLLITVSGCQIKRLNYHISLSIKLFKLVRGFFFPQETAIECKEIMFFGYMSKYGWKYDLADLIMRLQ